jgi:CRISPR/Cas system-associated exonuclease Cas4 (RecB family)
MISINFDKVIDDYLSSERKQDRRKRKMNIFYPSELTFPCLRCQYLRYTTPEVPLSPRTQRIFKIGSIIHEFIQDTFKKLNSEFVLVSLETPIRSSYRVNGDLIWIFGRADAIIERDGKEYLVELKSITPPFNTDDVFRFLIEPRERHLKQLVWYMQSANIHQGFILYIEKVGATLKTFPITLDTYRSREDLVATAKKLYQHLKGGILPPREPHHWNDKICNYCEYTDVCEQEDIIPAESMD